MKFFATTLRLLTFWNTFQFLNSFRWILDDDLPASQILTFSERYMFADNQGPDILDNGESHIVLSGLVSTYMTNDHNNSVEVTYAIYAAAEGHHHDSLNGMCASEETDITDNSWATSLILTTVPTFYVGTYEIYSPDSGLNGTYHQWDAQLDFKYIVTQESWHNIAFQVCTNKDIMPLATLDTLVTFKVKLSVLVP